MIVFYIVCIVFVLSIIGIIYSDRDLCYREGLNVISWTTAALSLFSFIIMLCAYPFQREEDKLLARRDYIECQLRDTTLSDYERNTIVHEAIDINYKIISEKTWSDSKWVGMFSSERVGNTPLIELHR